MNKRIELGDKVRCVITGQKGIAVCRSEWINGCVRWLVQPQKVVSGKSANTEWIDDEQLKVVKKAAVTLEAIPTGGDRDTPKMLVVADDREDREAA